MLEGHIILALPLQEAHHRDLALGREVKDRGDEPLADRIGQTRRGEARAPVVGEE
jgi:hypothetical protein